MSSVMEPNESPSEIEFAEWTPNGDDSDQGASGEAVTDDQEPTVFFAEHPSGSGEAADPETTGEAVFESFEEEVVFEEFTDSPVEPFDGESSEEPDTEGADDDSDVVTLELAEEDEDPERSTFGWGGAIASTVFHLWLVFTLAATTYQEDEFDYGQEILTARMEAEPLEEVEEPPIEFELAKPDERDLEVKKVIHAASLGMVQADQPELLSPPQPLTEQFTEQPDRPAYDLPQGREISETMVVQGTTGEGIVEIESALDRITWEVANHLQESKVLLVWMMDGSGSLVRQREKIAGRLNRVYGELDALEQAGQIPRRDQPLLSAVVTYGQKTNYLTDVPTADYASVLKSMQDIEIDESGQENVFTAVHQTLVKWGPLYRQEGRRVLMVLVTDESGDDFAMLEPAIKKSRFYAAHVYVVGPSAVFGRRQGYVSYVAPEDGETYRLPVDLGPETPMISRLNLPFWHDGPNLEYLSSGFGPYGLSRLVRETGGIYFMTNMTTMATLAPVGVYDGDDLKPFQPDYSFATPEQFLADVGNRPLRRAVWLASKQSETVEVPGMPPLRFRIEANNFRQQFEAVQRNAAIIEASLNRIGAVIPPGVEGLYEQEGSLRWRMCFDLAYGRLLAQKTRVLEYNMALADLKGSLSEQEINTSANEIILQPTSELEHAPQARRMQQEAQKHLQRIIDEAPGTPWAKLAARELRTPMGLRVVKNFIPPPPPNETGNAPGIPGNRIQLAPDPQPPRPPGMEPPPKPKPKLPRL